MVNINKIILNGLILSLSFSCSQYKEIIVENNQVTDNSNNNKINSPESIDLLEKLEIIAVAEMEDIPNLDKFSIVEKGTLTKETIISDLDSYKNEIENINFVEISRWAKKEMELYKLKDSAFANIFIEQNYTNSTNKLIKVKIDELPSHSPLVKRSLYAYILYSNKDNLKSIYITIQGYAEE